VDEGLAIQAVPGQPADNRAHRNPLSGPVGSALTSWRMAGAGHGAFPHAARNRAQVDVGLVQEWEGRSCHEGQRGKAGASVLGSPFQRRIHVRPLGA